MMAGWSSARRSQIKSRTRDVKQKVTNSRFAQKRSVQLVWRVKEEMSRDDATLMAAGVAYYTFLSLFPLLLALLAIAGLLLTSTAFEARFLDFVSQNLPGSADFVKDNVQGVRELRGPLGLIAIFGLLWSASAVFGAVARVVNRAFDIHRDRPFYIAKPLQIGMALAVFILFLLSTAVSSVIQFLDRDLGIPGQGFVINVLFRLIPLALSFCIFLLVYKLLPNGKTYWRYIWPGAAVAAVLFEIARNLFVWYLGTFASYNEVYGPLASVIVLLFWIYLSSMILILGAEVSSEYQKMSQPVASAEPQEQEERELAARV